MAVEPQSVEQARRAIEETRGRISATLDAIETKIEDKKDELRERADVFRPVKERIRANPLPMIGAALGVGIVLGLVTGGSDSGKLSRRERKELRTWRDHRRRHLEKKFGRGSAEHQRLRAASSRHEHDHHDHEHDHEEGESVQKMLIKAVTSGITEGLKHRSKR